MRLFDEFTEKHGFSDGDAVENHHEEILNYYILIINAIAEHLKSNHRAVKYLRSGAHNPFILLFINADLLHSLDNEEYPEHEIEIIDEAMEQAIELADALDIDSYLEISITARPEFSQLLDTIERNPLTVLPPAPIR